MGVSPISSILCFWTRLKRRFIPATRNRFYQFWPDACAPVCRFRQQARVPLVSDSMLELTNVLRYENRFPLNRDRTDMYCSDSCPTMVPWVADFPSGGCELRSSTEISAPRSGVADTANLTPHRRRNPRDNGRLPRDSRR